MRKQVFAVRLDEQTKNALAAAAIGGKTKPRTLAQQMIADGLMRAGYLPKARHQAQQVQA